jgi:phenylalanyl-tRNA synthetase beta chain
VTTTAPVVFEIDLAALLEVGMPAYREVSRQPAVIRDLALVVPQAQAFQPLIVPNPDRDEFKRGYLAMG